MITTKKAQTTFEYIILVAAVIFVLFIFLSRTGPFRNSVEKVMNKTVDQMLNNMVSNISYN